MRPGGSLVATSPGLSRGLPEREDGETEMTREPGFDGVEFIRTECLYGKCGVESEVEEVLRKRIRWYSTISGLGYISDLR